MPMDKMVKYDLAKAAVTGLTLRAKELGLTVEDITPKKQSGERILRIGYAHEVRVPLYVSLKLKELQG